MGSEEKKWNLNGIKSEGKEFPIIKLQSVSLGYEKGQRMLITNESGDKLQGVCFLKPLDRY